MKTKVHSLLGLMGVMMLALGVAVYGLWDAKRETASLRAEAAAMKKKNHRPDPNTGAQGWARDEAISALEVGHDNLARQLAILQLRLQTLEGPDG
ncbi:MAG: hypothetical protein ABW066_06750 [Sedimenticola sp.]